MLEEKQKVVVGKAKVRKQFAVLFGGAKLKQTPGPFVRLACAAHKGKKAKGAKQFFAPEFQVAYVKHGCDADSNSRCFFCGAFATTGGSAFGSTLASVA